MSPAVAGRWTPFSVAQPPLNVWVLIRGKNAIGKPMVPIVARRVLDGQGWEEALSHNTGGVLALLAGRGDSRPDWADLPDWSKP